MEKADLTGRRYGRWTVLGEGPRVTAYLKVGWRCRCDCGTERVLSTQNLTGKFGSSQSCGCLKRERAAGRSPGNTTHRMTGTPAYQAWKHMKDRCENPNGRCRRNYRDRGIRVCPEWSANFLAFLNDMGERPDGRTLDRIDNDGNYEPSNCRWATRQDQARNRRSSTHVTLHGVKRTVAEWSAITGIDRGAIEYRLHRGFPPERILSLDDHRRPIVLVHAGQSRSLREWAILTGVKKATLHARIAAGWPVDEVLAPVSR